MLVTGCWDHSWILPFMLITCLSQKGLSYSECSNYGKNDVIVVAFLNIHDETDCTKLSLRGLQQMAVLQKSVTAINEEEASGEGLHLLLHVVDICNPTERNVDASLRNLVTAQQTCQNPPLLLGFIGPEKHWKTIQRATSGFHKVQILPFMPETKEITLPESLLLHVGNDLQPLRSKIFLATLNQLRWKSVFVVVSANTDKKRVVDQVFNEVDLVCVTGLVEIPTDNSKLNSFYSSLRKEYQDTNSDGLVLFVNDPNDVLALLQEMDLSSDESNPPILLYLCNVGLKSWELPHNHTILVLQETSDLGSKFTLTPHHNKSLWEQYYAQNEVDYKRDAFGDLLDASLAPIQYALELYWNALKYAKKIKCDLGASSKNQGVCFDMLRTSPLEWKSFVYKASYYQPETLRKISLEMNLPVTVRLYFVNSVINFPQQIGRITEKGIMDLKMNLQTVIPSKAIEGGLRKCIPPTYKRDRIFNPIPMDHESNWLAVFSKKMKSWIQFKGLISPETTEVIHSVLMWVIALLAFFLGLILITKCVYGIFRVQTDDERDAAMRRQKHRRSTRMLTA